MDFKSPTLRVVVLLATLWAVLATSVAHKKLNSGRFNLVSDCVLPVADVIIDVSDSKIVSPPGASYTVYGFPTENVDQLGDPTGIVDGKERKCELTYGFDDSDEQYVYTCSDNGKYSCTITIGNP